MGIIYQFAIRFIKVKDISKIDRRAVGQWKQGYRQNDEYVTCIQSLDDDFEDYAVKAKENCKVLVKELRLDPGIKRGYVVRDITIPEDTDVIAFGWIDYRVKFYYKDSSDNYMLHVAATDERNRFMVIPRRKNPIRMSYKIGIDNRRKYTEADCRVVVG